MRVKRVAVSLLLTVAMTLAFVGTALADDDREDDGHRVRAGFAVGMRFRDQGQAPWAAKFITEMQVRSVIRGYADNTFRPNQPVTRQEVVAMVVRALGMEGRAQQVNASVYGSVYLPYQDAASIQPWAQGYIKVALDMGLLDTSETTFQAQAAASRVWVVPILVKAMGLDADARAAANARLTFRDAAAIPAAARGYVAIAINVGLVAGYPDNTFQPNKPVTRAEMAKVLEIMQANVQPPQQQQSFTARGVITAVSGSSITLAGAGNATSVYQVAYNAFIFLNDRPATLGDLKPGYMAELFLNQDGQAVFVDAKTAKPVRTRHPREAEVRGTVYAVDASGLSITVMLPDGTEETFPVAEWAEIELGGDFYGTLGDLKPGDLVAMKLRQGTVVKIEVKGIKQKKQAELKGVISAVDPAAGTVTVLLASGEEVTLEVADGAVITIKGYGRATLADVIPGDRAELKVTDGLVVKISVEPAEKKKQKESRSWSEISQDDGNAWQGWPYGGDGHDKKRKGENREHEDD